MIIDKLENLSKYINNDLASAISEFLKDAKNVTLGKHDIVGGTFANVLEYSTKVFETVKMEAHIKYLDLQYMVSGVEKVLYQDKGDNSPINEYNDVKDVIHYSPNTYTEHLLEEGYFGIMFPNDLHQCVCKDTPLAIKKIVVKIPVDAI